MTTHTGENEVYLGGTYFRQKGAVRLTNIAATPNPIIFGDTSGTSDSAAMLQLIQSSTTGGAGIYRGNVRTDAERHWTSHAETRYRLQTTTPPKTTNMAKPAGITADLTLTRAFNNDQYFAWGADVYRWVEASSTWSAKEQTLGGNATDMTTFLSKFYVAYGTGYYDRTTAGAWTNHALVATYLAVHDGKLWKLGLSGSDWTIYKSLDGAAWTTGGILPMEVTPSQLVVFRDSNGANQLYALTNTGLWAYDDTNTVWKQTDARFTPITTPDASKGVLFRDSKLYVTTGRLGMVSVQSGNPMVITPMGLDRDDGVPSDEQGSIVAVSADVNWLLAIIDHTTAGANDTQMTGFAGWDETAWANNTGPSTLRAWSAGWHRLYTSSNAAAPGKALDVSSAASKHRVYFGMDGNAYYQDLDPAVLNPLHNPTKQYESGTFDHDTPWWDYGTRQRKVGGHLFLETTGCDANNTVTVYYGTNFDDTTWTLLATISTNGLTELVPALTGVPCRVIRYRLRLVKGGADPQLHPTVRAWNAEAMRVLGPTIAYGLTLDLTGSYKGRSAIAQRDALLALVDPAVTDAFYEFSYRDGYGAQRSQYGRVSRVDGLDYTGETERGEGLYRVTVIVPYSKDVS